MKLTNPFKGMTLLEYVIWIGSLIATIIAFIIPQEKDYLNFFTSLIGVTTAIFMAKGRILGQITGLIYSIAYGIIAFYHSLYGEVFIAAVFYAPISIIAIVSWIRHQYEDTSIIRINKLNLKQYLLGFAITITTATASFFVLRALNTHSLVVSTISIATSTLAGYFSIRRSPLYALVYFLNDIVLIVLWGFETNENIATLPILISFVAYVVNDTYGFINWFRLRKKQNSETNE